MTNTNVEEKVNEVATQEEAEKKQYEVADQQGGGLELDLTAFGFSAEELGGLSGLNELNPTDITIPYASMTKKIKTDYALGDFEFADGTKVALGDEETTIDNISILQVMNVRVMFPDKFKASNSFICRSLDGKVGAKGSEYEGRSCDTCEFSKYPEEGGASPCRDQRLLLCAREDGSMFHLQVHGVDIKEWKSFLSSQIMHLLPIVKRKLGVEMIGAIKVSISCKMVTTEYGPFPALRFKVDPKDAFFDNDTILRNAQSLSSYNNFYKQESLESAAHQTQANMANGGDVVSEQGEGKNKELF
jgi:hypothetical protein